MKELKNCSAEIVCGLYENYFCISPSADGSTCEVAQSVTYEEHFRNHYEGIASFYALASFLEILVFVFFKFVFPYAFFNENSVFEWDDLNGTQLRKLRLVMNLLNSDEFLTDEDVKRTYKINLESWNDTTTASYKVGDPAESQEGGGLEQKLL
ncbi:MAG: hypothetical protein ACTSUE_05230 [Promethearchaeota archaeon]